MWPSLSGFVQLEQDYLCCSMYQYFVPFYSQICCMDVLHFVYMLISWWPFGSFPHLAVNDQCQTLGVQFLNLSSVLFFGLFVCKCLCRHVFSFLGYITQEWNWWDIHLIFLSFDLLSFNSHSLRYWVSYSVWAAITKYHNWAYKQQEFM